MLECLNFLDCPEAYSFEMRREHLQWRQVRWLKLMNWIEYGRSTTFILGKSVCRNEKRVKTSPECES
jgi:hypothetical protein